ncbi:MAG TPA: molybdopterin-binding protein [Candidatus Limnocylindria bacterium]|nr:molybdopterin-binding protein [Candidatus Limnocylindria bacterium]
MARAAPRARLLSIGSELLAGETVDSNAAFLARRLVGLGVELVGVQALPDVRETIGQAFSEARAAVELVLATGGLGPTHDDLTREGLADALGESLTPDPALEEQLRERFGRIGRMPPSNLRQALRIPSAEALANPIGSAPGWWVDRDERVTALMPGVPSEMRLMFDEQVAPRLVARFGATPLAVRTVKTFGIGESALAEMLGGLLDEPGSGVTAGIYARDDGVYLRFTTRAAAATLEAPVARCRETLGDAVWGLDHDHLPEVALAALGRAGAATVASWEADTQGALLSALAGAAAHDGAAIFVGGTLDAGGSPTAPLADAVIQLSLLPEDGHGRSRVRVAISGAVPLAQTETRIHGSGDQRLRRAAFAALDQVRRSLSNTGAQ